MELERELHASLQAMMEAIDTGQTGSIATHVQRIDELGQALGDETPPMLRHYLERRSYAKALDFLEGRDEARWPTIIWHLERYTSIRPPRQSSEQSLGFHNDCRPVVGPRISTRQHRPSSIERSSQGRTGQSLLTQDSDFF